MSIRVVETEMRTTFWDQVKMVRELEYKGLLEVRQALWEGRALTGTELRFILTVVKREIDNQDLRRSTLARYAKGVTATA